MHKPKYNQKCLYCFSPIGLHTSTKTSRFCTRACEEIYKALFKPKDKTPTPKIVQIEPNID